ncbi:metallophosphoesterase [bacterium]|nr:metallophosphoesterase [bacterium]
MKFLVFGDVTGRVGREGMATALPQLREEFEPDMVIANIENIAHGSGITPDTVQEALGWGVDVLTTGDHAWDNTTGTSVLNDPTIPIIRPANYPDGIPGRGWIVVKSGAWQIAVINIQGQVFFKNDPANPFQAIDDILKQPEIAGADIRLVDFHAEASSEKRAFGWHADGRIAAIWGTHTHVPTADAQILPEKTGYITDLGMVGLHDSVIGADTSGAMKRFLTQTKHKLTYDGTGGAEIGGLFLEIDPSTGSTTHIEHVRRVLT